MPAFIPDPSTIRWFRQKKFVYFSDIVNSQWVAKLMFLLSLFYAGIIYAMRSLSCTAQTGIKTDTIENYCLYEEALFNVNKSVNLEILNEDDRIKYYKSVWFDLLLGSLIIYIPQFFWSCIVYFTYGDLPEFLDQFAARKDGIGHDDQTVQYFTSHFTDMMEDRKDLGCLKEKFICIGYLAVKIAYCVNSVFLLHHAAKVTNSSIYEVVTMIVSWDDVTLNHLFPSTAICDYIETATMTTFRERYPTCTLHGNFILKRIFWWLCMAIILLIVVNGFALLERAVWMFSKTYRHRQIDSWLKKLENQKDQHDKEKAVEIVKNFKNQAWYFKNIYLGKDGVFMLDLMARNISLRTTKIICREVFVFIVELE